MSALRRTLKRTTLPVLVVLCLAALTASYAYADGALRPLATQIIGDPDAAVTGKLAVGTASPGNKALTVVGVIDFLGAGTVHNYFTQGTGNNMQVNTNVDEANVVGNATKSQWKLVLGSSLDWFSIRRSPASATYNEDALFFIDGSTGNVGIATVDTGNLATIPLTPPSRLYVETASGDAIRGIAKATSGIIVGVYGESNSTSGYGVYSMGNMRVNGSFTATGTKAAIVDTQDYGWRSLYAMESPQNWFEDFGRATLTAGEAVVPIEQVFAQTVNLNEDYHVFLTPLGGGCTLFVTDQTATGFTVRANEGAGCEITFDYRIIAARLEYEDLRLKPAENPEAVAASAAAVHQP